MSRPEPRVPSPNLFWHAAEDGQLAVFSARDIRIGEVVERCYCLPVDRSRFGKAAVLNWLYDRGDGLPWLFALGWGLLYNEVSADSSRKPNLAWEHEVISDVGGSDRHYIILRARRDIQAVTEELCVVRKHGQDDGALRNIFSKTCSEFNCSVAKGFLRSPLPSSIEVQHSPLHGNGVFAKRSFRRGETVEVVPSLPLDYDSLYFALRDYASSSSETIIHGVIDLGYGAIYNHSFAPNIIGIKAGIAGCKWAYELCGNFTAPQWNFIALRDIEAGEELCQDYGPAYWAACVLRSQRPSLWEIGTALVKSPELDWEEAAEIEEPSMYNFVD
jgi:hypothetical protein